MKAGDCVNFASYNDVYDRQKWSLSILWCLLVICSKHKNTIYSNHKTTTRRNGRRSVFLARWSAIFAVYSVFQPIKTTGGESHRPDLIWVVPCAARARGRLDIYKMAALGGAEEDLQAPVCPITHDWMRDPYYCAVDGQTYEKVAIFEWVNKNHNSPMTRQRVELKDLCKSCIW